jgi:hypothetical protein
MTTTALAWLDGSNVLVSDSDLKVLHPRIVQDLWTGKENYSDQLQSAFGQLLRDLALKGLVSAQIPNSAANRELAKQAVIRLALARIFLDFITEKDDKWSLLRAEYLIEYQSMLDSATLEYDADDDGTTDDGTVTTEVRFVR